MPSHLHETLVEMFRERPTLATDLLTGRLGIAVPGFHDAAVSSADLTDRKPTEYRADAVLTFSDDGNPVLAVIVEAQLRVDQRKRRSWPVYVTSLYARLGCEVQLLVIAPRRRVAAWCATPIVISRPGLTHTPLVLGPDQLPVVTDSEQALACLELAVLSAVAHGDRPERDQVFTALFDGLQHLHTTDPERAYHYTDVVLTGVTPTVREHLEAFMATTAYRFESDFARRHIAHGRTEGKLEGKLEGESGAVLKVLDTRGITVPERIREEITRCTDAERIDLWLRRAVTADTVDDLFG
jgi:hypothetical protein